ncbi:Imm70 family immunity protein [Streptococcus taonis]|uniref:Imm70 family immunity protein n=1 Tax=Streptococcus taonis TaxID=3041623 RepID=UPI003CCBEBD5
MPFLTVFIRFEHSNWGSRHPTLMTELYQGRFSVYYLKNCLLELQSICIEFSKLSSYDNVCGFESVSSVEKVLRFLLCRSPCLLHYERKIDFK